MLGIAALAGSGGQTSGATCPLVLRARPSVYIRGMLSWTLQLCRFMGESRSDLHIPAGPAGTNRTALAEEASHSAWPPSPASSSPCPSQASRMPFSAAWSECKGKVQKIIAEHDFCHRSSLPSAVRRSYLQMQSAGCSDLGFSLQKNQQCFGKLQIHYHDKNEWIIH